MVSNRWNQLRYRVYAPVYDVLARPLEHGRQRAIERLDPQPNDRILVVGCGTGMDVEYLPAEATIAAVDLTPTMVRRTARRGEKLDRSLTVACADAERLPFGTETFDAVLLHLVLSVVPDPYAVMSEAARVLSPTGRISLYDKFHPAEGDLSTIRRMANPLARILFADLNRPLEQMLSGTSLTTDHRETFLRGLYTVTIATPTATE